MANKYAESFLNCVLKRNESDNIMRLGALLMVVAVTPVVVIGAMIIQIWFYDMIEALDFNDFVGVMLITSTIAAFYMLFMVTSAHKHYLRDKRWMEALSGYAASYGRDTAEMDAVASQFDDAWISRIRKGFMYYFLIILVANVLQSILLFASVMEMTLSMEVVGWLFLIVNIELVIASLYLFIFVRKHDGLQCEFTSLFCESMKEELPDAVPMDTRIKNRMLWLHIILTIVTLGLYAFIFSLWVLHTMNLHIARQWTYEERLLKLIMARENATGIRKIDAEPETDLIKIAIKNMEQII